MYDANDHSGDIVQLTMAVAPRQLKKLFCTKFLAEKLKSPWAWVTALIWSVGIVSMSSLTIRDFIPLLSDYQTENVDTKLTVVKLDSVRRPNITVCMPYFSWSLAKIAWWVNQGNKDVCEECQALADHGWDVWNDGTPLRLVHSAITEIALAEKLMQKLLLEEKDSGFQSLTINRTNFNWNQPIVDAVYLFFFSYHDLDNTVLVKEKPMEYGSLDLRIARNVTDAHRDELYQKYLDAFTTYLMAMLEFQLDPFDRARPLAFYHFYFCIVTIGKTDEDFGWVDQNFFHDPNIPTPPWRLLSRNIQATIWPDETPMFWFPSVADVLYKTPEKRVSTATKEYVDITYSITSAVVQRREGVPCSPEPNRVKCMAVVQAKVAIEKCGCQPFSYRYYMAKKISSIPYCGIEAYRSCIAALQRALNRSQDACNNVCEYVVYSWKVESSLVGTETDPDDKNLYFRLGFYPIAKPYIEFSVVTKTTPEMFVSQIGGLVNLYLGVDGLSICAGLILLWDYARKRRNSGQQNGSKDSSTSQQHRTSVHEKWKESITKEMASLQEDVAAALRDNEKVKNQEDNSTTSQKAKATLTTWKPKIYPKVAVAARSLDLSDL